MRDVLFEDVVGLGLRIILRFDRLVSQKRLGLVRRFSVCSVRGRLSLVVERRMLLVREMWRCWRIV